MLRSKTKYAAGMHVYNLTCVNNKTCGTYVQISHSKPSETQFVFEHHSISEKVKTDTYYCSVAVLNTVFSFECIITFFELSLIV